MCSKRSLLLRATLNPNPGAAAHSVPLPTLLSWHIWKLMQQYFAAELHKTVDLDPQASRSRVARQTSNSVQQWWKW